MRILQIAPLWETVPPPAYGGTEAVVSALVEELVRMGHDVTLAASGDSRTSATLHAVYHRSLRNAPGLGDPLPYHWAHIGSAISLSAKFDLVHNHAGELAMAMSHLVSTPMLTTVHSLPPPDTELIWRSYHGAYNSLSANQRSQLLSAATTTAREMGYVYNAIDVDSFPFSPARGDDLLFLSRLSPEKGPHHAIEAARRCGRRLILAGKIGDQDRRFFDEVIAHQIDDDQIVFLGEADARQKRNLYRNARCLLLPITWDEPFGLVMPEAMACGTPVIAFNRGSAPELIEHGLTGFVVDSIDKMVDAIGAVSRISREECRRAATRRFSPHVMAEGYARIYQQLMTPRSRDRETIVASMANLSERSSAARATVVDAN